MAKRIACLLLPFTRRAPAADESGA